MYAPQDPNNPQAGMMPVGAVGQLPPGMQPGMMPPGASAQAAQPSPMAGTAPPGQIDPAMVQQMLALQQQQPQMQAQQRQMKLAEALRGDAAGQMQGTRAGGVYSAPGLLNLAANVAGNYAATQKDKGAESELAKLGQQRTQAMGDYFKALTGGLRSGAADPYEG